MWGVGAITDTRTYAHAQGKKCMPQCQQCGTARKVHHPGGKQEIPGSANIAVIKSKLDQKRQHGQQQRHGEPDQHAQTPPHAQHDSALP